MLAVIIAAVVVGLIGLGLAYSVYRAHIRPPADHSSWSPPGWVLVVGAWCAIALSVVVGPWERHPHTSDHHDTNREGRRG